MDGATANTIAFIGMTDAISHLREARKHPEGSLECERLRLQVLADLAWSNDDDVIDALYDQDMRDLRRDERAGVFDQGDAHV